MKKANNLLKISSIIYILIGLLTIYFSEATSAIFLSLGLYLLSLGFLPLDELQNKKTEIILIAIISILINIVIKNNAIVIILSLILSTLIFHYIENVITLFAIIIISLIFIITYFNFKKIFKLKYN